MREKVTGQEALRALVDGKYLRREGNRRYYKLTEPDKLNCHKRVYLEDDEHGTWRESGIQKLDSICAITFTVYDEIPPKFKVGEYIANKYDVIVLYLDSETDGGFDTIKSECVEDDGNHYNVGTCLTHETIEKYYRHATDAEVAYYFAFAKVVKERGANVVNE